MPEKLYGSVLVAGECDDHDANAAARVREKRRWSCDIFRMSSCQGAFEQRKQTSWPLNVAEQDFFEPRPPDGGIPSYQMSPPPVVE